MPSHDYQKSGLKIILEDSFKFKSGQAKKKKRRLKLNI